MRSTFRTAFYVNRSKERNGHVPIMGRITINGTIAQFSCKLLIKKELWDARGNRASGRSHEAEEVNNALDSIRARIAGHYRSVSERSAYVTAEMVRNAFHGFGIGQETLLRAFDRENAAFSRRVGKDRSMRTYRKYLTVRKYVGEFMRKRYRRSDMAMSELSEDFIRDFCHYLRCEAGLSQSTVWVYSLPLKHIVTAAHCSGSIQRNPFALFRVGCGRTERGFLTEAEMQALSAVRLDDLNLAMARDLFLFGCWTGISFSDIKNLTAEHLVEINGRPWIVSRRQKTGTVFQVRLMDAPMRILKRYEPFRTDSRLFNAGSLGTMNQRIKNVAKKCGISRPVSFHLARHSFAVMAMNYGMPIESISRILGHTSIATTQIYAKVICARLERDMSAFEETVRGMFPG
ncbi:MAG TPA: site-specific integrase [Candidatus Coprenecus stercoravium]|uniref:Site-specific integrase n=1 Tax=Candidatus Coprenecus stercoravium TaxID=2840735 RepID=A0A9D2GQZ3_9BACT|nr:site-specific integrase [Candidatus Coprenecus stercoravium]